MWPSALGKEWRVKMEEFTMRMVNLAVIIKRIFAVALNLVLFVFFLFSMLIKD